MEQGEFGKLIAEIQADVCHKNKYDVEFTYLIPEDAFDVFDLSNALFNAGFEDAVIGTGIQNTLAVSLEVEGEDILSHTALDILSYLPKGSELRSVIVNLEGTD